MISPRLFLTNNHVLPDQETAGGSLAQFEYLTTASGTARDPHLYLMRPDIFFVTDAKLDISIVALEDQNAAKQPLELRGWCPLIAGSGKAIKGERVNIIQHPSGERMQVTVRENTIVAVEEQFLQYEADTQPGSSGAPVFNDQWEMAALHHAGVPKRDAKKRILTRSGKPWSGRREDADDIDWVANEGVRISSLMEHVDQQYVKTGSVLWRSADTLGKRVPNLRGRLICGIYSGVEIGRAPVTDLRPLQSPGRQKCSTVRHHGCSGLLSAR